MNHKEIKLAPFYQEGIVEVGCDEAGRGCLAGPLFAAAVILPSNFYHPLLNDSKKVSPSNRELLRLYIEKEAVEWAVGSVSPAEIDKINILNASFLAMHRALDALSGKFQLILVDGNRFTPYREFLHQCIVGGDAKYNSIAAASILAKSHRDNYMRELASKYCGYGWERNMGYPTKEHKEAIEKFGTTKEHRLTFNHKL